MINWICFSLILESFITRFIKINYYNKSCRYSKQLINILIKKKLLKPTKHQSNTNVRY